MECRGFIECQECGQELVEFGRRFLIHKYHPKQCSLTVIRKETYYDLGLGDESIAEEPVDEVK